MWNDTDDGKYAQTLTHTGKMEQSVKRYIE